MVSSPRGTSDTRRVRRLKSPRPIEVEAAQDGKPLRLRLGGAWQDIEFVRRPWRIDQHWWRPGGDGPVSRLYYRVAPEDGPPLTIYHDLLSGTWRRQEY
jgi:hypothetical protein